MSQKKANFFQKDIINARLATLLQRLSIYCPFFHSQVERFQLQEQVGLPVHERPYSSLSEVRRTTMPVSTVYKEFPLLFFFSWPRKNKMNICLSI